MEVDSIEPFLLVK